MTEIELLIDLFKDTERQGPGSKVDTLKALDFISLPRDKEVSIVDIGCGSGGQTLTLAEQLNGKITAVDVFPEFLDELIERARRQGLEEKINTLENSMEELPFEREVFDIIWAEGAIYHIGFEKGVSYWNTFLKAGGYLAVSEITWITAKRPKEIEDFWTREYPEIDTASNKIQVLESNGYTLAGYFYFPPSSWLETYYEPMEARFETFLARNSNSNLAKKVVEDHKREIELYLTYKEYYSYGFYIAKKNSSP